MFVGATQACSVHGALQETVLDAAIDRILRDFNSHRNLLLTLSTQPRRLLYYLKSSAGARPQKSLAAWRVL